MSEKITIDNNGDLVVPKNPVIPFIEGDGIGPEVWQAAKFVMDSAVEKAYSGEKKIDWMEVYAGEKAFNKFNKWLPDETVEAFEKYLVGIKGPLTTPVGGGIRSLNVALRQKLDLYVCLRPVKYYGGIETPMRRPEKVDMIIFRENTEDIYTGIEFKPGTEENRKFWEFIKNEYPEQFEKIRFGTLEKTNEFLKMAGMPEEDMVEIGFGVKIMSKTGSQRLMIAAIKYAIEHKRKSITIVHKGNIMKFTSGAFRDWCYDIAEEKFGEHVYTWRQWEQVKKEKGKKEADLAMNNARSFGKIIIKEAIADNALQQVLTNPEDFDILATGNLNGDYLSDAVAAQVGGIGIAPGGNINYITGHAIFEATHGTAPSFAGMNKVNPSSLILSGMMMMQYLGWGEAAQMIDNGVRRAIDSKNVTFDFANQMLGATEVSTSEFAGHVVKNFV
jgi:isocitrate dehydrogenase